MRERHVSPVTALWLFGLAASGKCPESRIRIQRPDFRHEKTGMLKVCRRSFSIASSRSRSSSSLLNLVHSMPDFASQDYWDTRFANDSKPFDWLIPATALRDVASDMIEESTLQKSCILHIGSGTSDSLVLRELVHDPKQIHNVDYSEAAIEAASHREEEHLAQAEDLLETSPWKESKHDSVQQSTKSIAKAEKMRWSCMDLLSLQSTLGLLRHEMENGKLYDVVLDKSTSDSISCGSDLHLNLPYPLSINGWTRRIMASGAEQPGDVHPLHVLAVHLAALTTPRTGRWIAISYSEDRFPFLPPFPATAGSGMLSNAVIKAGFPHPHQLWRLERKEKIDMDANREETLAQRKKRLSTGLVQRPKLTHWLYVLRRTDTLVID